MHSCNLPDAAAPAGSARGYTTGTLHYSRRGIFVLFGWLLWGDFAFTFFESIFGRFMPLYFKDLNASNTLIGIMTGSISGLVNIFFLPVISQWSDTLRHRLGRRIPFLLVVTPVTVASLVSIGFAPELGGWLHGHVTAALFPRLSAEALVLSLLCFFVILYHCFNMVLVNSYNWLLRDVVPQAVMAWFLSWFRIVGTLASCIFLWYVFPAMIGYRKETCVGVGAFYLCSFLLMCWKVKEGAYPPPPQRAARSLASTFAVYFRNCLSLALYRNYFIAFVLVTMATATANSFLTLYAKHTLHLNMEEIGGIFAYAALLSAVVYVPVGWLCNKWTAMRVTLASLGMLIAGSILAYFLVTGKQSWLVYSLLFTLPTVGWSLGSLAITMQLFPSQDFGQFSSGLNVFGCGGLIAGNFLIGRLMDMSGSDYRLVFLWSGVLYLVAVGPMLCVYRDWKRHGGPDRYEPPLPRGE